jgi:transposase
MRWHGRRVTVYAYGAPADMRKGFDGLSALVMQKLAKDPLNGDVYAKRLERGRFASLWRADARDPIRLTVSELDLFLDGSTLVGRLTLTPPALTHFSLASHRSR